MQNIPQYPKYSISQDGKTVINNESGKALKQATDEAGYVWVTLFLTENKQYGPKRIGVHRLVAFTYLPTPNTKQTWVNHKDGIKGNNDYSNLEWTTPSENIQHSYDILKRKKYYGAEHWNTGVKRGKVTRNRMSKKKIGELHPKFKGWYSHKGKKYTSLREAEMETGISRRKIRKNCAGSLHGWSFIGQTPVFSETFANFEPKTT